MRDLEAVERRALAQRKYPGSLVGLRLRVDLEAVGVLGWNPRSNWHRFDGDLKLRSRCYRCVTLGCEPWCLLGDLLPKQPGSLREIHYRNKRDLPLRLCTFASLRLFLPSSRDLYGRSTTNAGISAGDPLPLRLCTFASLRLFLLNSLTRGHHPHPPTPCSRQRGGAAFLSRC